MSRIRILPTLSALILTFAILFGGYQVYRNYDVVQPLEKQLLHIHAVEAAHIIMTGQTPTVYIRLGYVPDLQTTYLNIQNDVSANIDGPVNIELKDRRNALLLSVYQTVQPILSQGIALGYYLNMISQIQAACAKQHIESKVTMNTQDIFIQLRAGSAYLYDIVPYTIKR